MSYWSNTKTFAFVANFYFQDQYNQQMRKLALFLRKQGMATGDGEELVVTVDSFTIEQLEKLDRYVATCKS